MYVYIRDLQMPMRTALGMHNVRVPNFTPRDRAARTGKMVQAGYAESVRRTFGMWDCNPVLTLLDPNVRLTKRDWPEAVDPHLFRRMRSIVGCL